jgi:Endonuclease NucS
MNLLEDKIRDYLAEHLDLLEQGLVLIRKEFPLPNPNGVGGRVDIVAKDRFGHVVVIEIKRSNQAARHALNEIHKYTALFRVNQGLDEKTLRLIVVSTEWHELLVPLVEYAESTTYSVEGVQIVVDANGCVSKASLIDLVGARNSVGALKISRCQGIYLFESAAERDRFGEVFPSDVETVGIQDFALLRVDYNGSNLAVIYPHGIYLFFSSPLSNTNKAVLRRIKRRIAWDNDLDEPDDNFLCAIEQNRTCNADTFEIGYPEKLTTLLLDWSVSIAKRCGRLSQSSLTDAELIALAQAVSGGSDYYFGKTTSPRFKAAWNAFRENVFSVVRGYPTWETVLPKLLNEIERKTPRAVVSCSLYGPANLLMSLYSIAANGDYSQCPRLEILVEDSESRTVRAFLGFLVWNGVKVTQSFSAIVKSVFGDIFAWMVAVNFGETFHFEVTATAAHNLNAVLVEWRFTNGTESGPHELKTKKDKLERLPPEAWLHKPINEFAESHLDYLAELRHVLEENVAGIQESIHCSAKMRV